MGIHHKIHRLLPDFPISKDIPWLFTEFPDFSLTLKNNNFPDFSLTAGNPEQMLQHIGLENMSTQEKIFNTIKIVNILCQTLCKTWKQIKFTKKYLANDIWMRT